MKPLTIRIIILLMGISMIGTVYIQYFWIMNAVKVNEAHFDRNVNEALNELVAKIETSETCRMITTRISWSDSVSPFVADPTANIPGALLNTGAPVPARTLIVRQNSNTDTCRSLMYFKSCDNAALACAPGDSAKEQNIYRTTLTINNDTSERIKIAVFNNKVDVKTEKFKSVIEKMLIENESRNIPLQIRLREIDFGRLLRGVLARHALDLPYEYQISSSRRYDKALTTPGYDTTYKGNIYTAGLFPNDLVEKSDTLRLYFPGKSGYIVHSLLLMISGSVVFTLVVLLTFIITIFAILRQKKLADIKNDFINNMTHEFKTPIATISLASDSISSPRVLEDKALVQYFSRVIKEEALRMNTKVERVLQFSLFDRNNINFSLVRLPLHDTIDKATEKIRLQLGHKNGQLTTSYAAGTYFVEADEEHLISALLNILDNALKYASGAPSIHITTYPEGRRHLCIAIADKGIGIARRDQKKIFERFYRVHTGDVHNVKGFGLGLSYVKEIITAFGGTVSVHSVKGEGATFIIRLPLVS